MPGKDRAEVGGWKSEATIRLVYDKADRDTMYIDGSHSLLMSLVWSGISGMLFRCTQLGPSHRLEREVRGISSQPDNRRDDGVRLRIRYLPIWTPPPPSSG
jgi:hypothetical protein